MQNHYAHFHPRMLAIHLYGAKTAQIPCTLNTYFFKSSKHPVATVHCASGESTYHVPKPSNLSYRLPQQKRVL